MEEERDAHEESEQPLGVLACVTTGFEIVARRPILIALPLLLDLFLWLGPRLSIDPSLLQFRQWLEAGPSSELLDMFFDELVGHFNLFSALNPGPLLGLPTLMTARMTVQRPFGPQPEMIVSSGLAFATVIVLGVVGLGLNVVYLRRLGWSVIEETEAPLTGPGRWLDTWWSMVQFAIILLILLFIMNIPFSCLATAMGLGVLPAPIVAFLLMMGMSLLLFLAFHLIFVIPGVVQLRRPAFQAIRESIMITRADFMGVMGLLIVIFVVSQGLDFVWLLPEASRWATLVGLAGHAFISTALIAALFVFYQERLELLRILTQAFTAQPATPPADVS